MRLRSVLKRQLGLGGLSLALAAVVLGSSPSQASLLTDFSGNTQPVVVNGAAGYINFVVYDQTGSLPGDIYGTGVAGADTILNAAGISTAPGNFLYLFEVANHATNLNTNGAVIPAPPLSSATVRIDQSTLTSDGVLASGIVATYLGNPLTGGDPGTAVTFGPTGPAVNSTSGSPANASVGIVTGANISFGGATTATSIGTVTPTSLQANFAPGDIPASGISQIFGYTSSRPPDYATGSIQDGGTASNGTVPGNIGTVVPEPGTIAMIASALPVGAVIFLRRRAKRGSTPPVA